MMKKIMIVSLILNVLLGVGLMVAWAAVDLVLGPERHDRRQSQFELFARPKGGIVFVGDSITHQGIWSELFERSDVYNRGIGGDTTAGVLDRIESIEALEPRQIFLMIGVNDLNGRESDIADRYDQILEHLLKHLPETQIFVQSVLPVGEDWFATNNASIRSLNEEILALTVKHDLPFLNLHSRFVDDAGALRAELTNDGIHLMADGYVVWANVVGDFLAD